SRIDAGIEHARPLFTHPAGHPRTDLGHGRHPVKWHSILLRAPTRGGDMAAETIYILSLDGGGIYGLTQALWLERICLEDPPVLDTTLTGAPRHCFSGTSSGAVNALLLAAEENPRTLVTSGKLSQFWRQPGLYVNRNPFEWALSFLGITPWLGTHDAMAVL